MSSQDLYGYPEAFIKRVAKKYCKSGTDLSAETQLKRLLCFYKQGLPKSFWSHVSGLSFRYFAHSYKISLRHAANTLLSCEKQLSDSIDELTENFMNRFDVKQPAPLLQTISSLLDVTPVYVNKSENRNYSGKYGRHAMKFQVLTNAQGFYF